MTNLPSGKGVSAVGGLDDDEIAGQPMAAVTVYTCNRLGMQANPPAWSFGGWFRRR